MASDKEHQILSTQNEAILCNSSSSDDSPPDPLVIQEKIRCAFSKVDSSSFNGLVQFWAPVDKIRLTTSDQPFAHKHTGPYVHRFENYRLNSQKYHYSLDVNTYDIESDPMIINGPPATAFFNHLPEVAMDMSVVHKLCPLLRYALEECKLTSYFMLPVFYTSSCVGVVECSMEMAGIFTVLQMVKQALKSVGLSMFHVQECRSYKTTLGLERAKFEIEEALDMVCESHVWIPYEIQNHVPLSSSFEGTPMKQMSAVKLTGSCVDSDDDLLFGINNYYDTCDIFPLKFGDGLVGNTLQTYEPLFCKNTYELPIMKDKNLLLLLSSSTKCSCLVICLRSIHTGDTDYAFEFLWPRTRNHFILLESLLLTLQSCLPSFRFASGEQLGDELCVVDVENSTGSGTGYINILEGNRISPIPKALEDRCLVAEDCISSLDVKRRTTRFSLPQEGTLRQYGRPMNEATENLIGWQ